MRISIFFGMKGVKISNPEELNPLRGEGQMNPASGVETN